MKTIKVLVEITVDEDHIEHLYPNYRFNWDDVDEFIDNRIDGLETPMEVNGLSIDYLKEFGYSIRVLSRDESKLLDTH
jgi:hypothetical protein